jgi:transcription initiation factor TFIID subunit 5
MSTNAVDPTIASPDENMSLPIVVDQFQQPSNIDKLVLDYLRARGHQAVEKALLEVLEEPEDKSQETTFDSAEFAKQLATFTTGGIRDTLNNVDTAPVQGLTATAVGAEEILASDPSDKQLGFRELESWVDGSLDMYRVCISSTIIQIYFDMHPARVSTHPVSHILSFLP